jgi:multidrug resistance efflux pump
MRLFAIAIVALSLTGCSRSTSPKAGHARPERLSTGTQVTVKRTGFHSVLRISGIVGAVDSYGVQAPRLTGQMSSTMVITKIVRNGTRVRAGDILVELDRQNQLKNILDKQAEYDNLVQQIRKKQADHAAAHAADETELKGAEVDVQTARVEMRKNEVIPGYQAEINKVNLAEAEAKLKQLKDTYALKHVAQAAELRILEIQRDRAKMAVDYAQGNIENMTVKSPMDGLAVLTPSSKGSRIADPQEGDEVRSGSGIMVVVDPSAMQVTARVNQVDISQVHVGQAAQIRLDAYPGLVFPGKVEKISAIGTPSNYLKRIRYFTVVVSIQGSNPKLLPDLTAAVDLQLDGAADALTLPREAVVIQNGKATVEMLENVKSKLAQIEIGPMNECDVVVKSGIKAGAIVSRNPLLTVNAGRPASGKI